MVEPKVTGTLTKPLARTSRPAVQSSRTGKADRHSFHVKSAPISNRSSKNAATSQ